MPSQTKENYLKAAFFLHLKDENIGITELAKLMEVSTPTANSMVKKMEGEGWVKYTKYKPLKLTKRGLVQAALIVRKHRLTEMFLTKIMGFGWEQVHDIAEQIEHIHSDQFFNRMDELLGYPTVDPHGSPIPNRKGEIERKKYKKLTEFEAGAKVRLCSFTESDNDLLHYLNLKNIKLGTEFTVVSVQSFDGSYEVKYNNQQIVLSELASSCFLVESVN